jgi:hypothetical protein
LAVESRSMLAWPRVVFHPIRAPDACVDVSLAWLAEREDAAAGLFAAFVRDHAPMTCGRPSHELPAAANGPMIRPADQTARRPFK